jgi:hypothetical protein
MLGAWRCLPPVNLGMLHMRSLASSWRVFTLLDAVYESQLSSSKGNGQRHRFRLRLLHLQGRPGGRPGPNGAGAPKQPTRSHYVDAATASQGSRRLDRSSRLVAQRHLSCSQL